MTKPTLGRLESVDLRSYWPHEAMDFTPWLAQDQHIDLLGEALGLNLRGAESEVRVGPFGPTFWRMRSAETYRFSSRTSSSRRITRTWVR